MSPQSLNVLYWIISVVFMITVFILVVTWDRKAKKEQKWREQERRNQLDHLLSVDRYDENSYS